VFVRLPEIVFVLVRVPVLVPFLAPKSESWKGIVLG